MGLEVAGAAMVYSALIGGAATATTAAIQNNASKSAAKKAGKANDEALAFEKERDAADRADAARIEAENAERYRVEQAREQQRYETDLGEKRRKEAQDLALYEAKQGRLSPYRDTGVASLNELARLAGLSVQPSTPPESMTQGWSGDKMTPPTGQAPFVPPPAGDANRKMGALGR